MAVPDFQSFLLPALEALSDKKERRRQEVIERVAVRLGLTEADRQERLPSGKHLRHAHRTSWALFDLLKAEFIARPARGVFVITPAGAAALALKPARIDVAFLNEHSAPFRAFKAASEGATAASGTPGVAKEEEGEAANVTPEEQLDAAYRALRAGVESELLAKLLAASPAFLERIVVDLLVAMGYGGSVEDAGEALGGSGDEGIDGTIKEDSLGLDMLYLQAKRWAPSRTVGRPDIQQFAGSLAGQRARKGVFITTSSFSKEAREYVNKIDAKIVLIDGAKLTALMFDHGIGVRERQSYVTKELDEELFEDN